jgi:ABC-type Fe3+-hydroxamate transport system substrate-binding protein
MLVTDQINHKFELETTPKRIISLVPSQTELLFDLGLDEEVVGITKFCIHPSKWFNSKNRIGGTKTVNYKKIKALKPDLIIANKEENTQSEIEELQKIYPVYTSDIYNLEDSLNMIETIGKITKTDIRAKEIVHKIKSDFLKLKSIEHKKNKVLYFIWQNPYMTIGPNTFINDMLNRSGFKHIDLGNRYPEVSETQLQKLNPDFIFLSSEPYPFKEKDIKKFKELCPSSKVLLVDGEMFSWYGSRLLKSVKYFIDLNDKIS